MKMINCEDLWELHWTFMGACIALNIEKVNEVKECVENLLHHHQRCKVLTSRTLAIHHFQCKTAKPSEISKSHDGPYEEKQKCSDSHGVSF